MRAMNSVPIVRPSTAPERKTTVASGMKKEEISSGNRNVSRDVSMSAGSAASDERDEKATACAGSAARAKAGIDIPPSHAAAGYRMPTIKTAAVSETSTTYVASA